MIMNKCIALAVLAAMLASCSNDITHESPSLRVKASVNGAHYTSSDEAFVPGDVIGIPSLEGLEYRNVPYVCGSDGTFAAQKTPISLRGDEELTFSAYYPYNADLIDGGRICHTVSADDQLPANQGGIDFLYARGSKASAAFPVLNFTGDNAFRHCMSLIEIDLCDGEGVSLDGNLVSFSLSGIYLKGSFEPVEGVAMADDSSAPGELEIAIADVQTDTIDGQCFYKLPTVILFPQGGTGSFTLKVKANEQSADSIEKELRTYTAELSVPSVIADAGECPGLVSGYKYRYRVRVSKGAAPSGLARSQVQDSPTVEVLIWR